jgi:hypothetical protein
MSIIKKVIYTIQLFLSAFREGRKCMSEYQKKANH